MALAATVQPNAFLSFETPCEAACLPGDEGCCIFVLTIFLYLPSCVHSSPKRGRFRSGLWRGGEAAPAPVEYRSAVPGGLLKAAWRSGSFPEARRKRLRRLCVGQKANAFARSCELARPGLRRGRVRERRKAWRRRAIPYGPAEGDGERRSGGEILSALRDAGLSSAPDHGGNPAGRSRMKRPRNGTGISVLADGSPTR